MPEQELKVTIEGFNVPITTALVVITQEMERRRGSIPVFIDKTHRRLLADTIVWPDVQVAETEVTNKIGLYIEINPDVFRSPFYRICYLLLRSYIYAYSSHGISCCPLEIIHDTRKHWVVLVVQILSPESAAQEAQRAALTTRPTTRTGQQADPARPPTEDPALAAFTDAVTRAIDMALQRQPKQPDLTPLINELTEALRQIPASNRLLSFTIASLQAELSAGKTVNEILASVFNKMLSAYNTTSTESLPVHRIAIIDFYRTLHTVNIDIIEILGRDLQEGDDYLATLIEVFTQNYESSTIKSDLREELLSIYKRIFELKNGIFNEDSRLLTAANRVYNLFTK